MTVRRGVIDTIFAFIVAKLGEVLYIPKFAKPLERIRDNPEDFYNGELAKDIVQDIEDIKESHERGPWCLGWC